MTSSSGNRWVEDEAEDEDGREDGELAADPQAPSAKRQRHEPIVWASKRDKQPESAGGSGVAAGSESQREPHLDKVESTTRLTGLDSGAAGSPAGPAAGSQGPPRPRTAAELIAAEAEDFQRRAALEGDDVDPAAPPAMRASPSGSDDGGESSGICAELLLKHHTQSITALLQLVKVLFPSCLVLSSPPSHSLGSAEFCASFAFGTICNQLPSFSRRRCRGEDCKSAHGFGPGRGSVRAISEGESRPLAMARSG